MTTASDDARLLRRVVDELEIRNLLARLHHTIDALRRGEVTEDDYARNWTDDAIWESPSMGTYRGLAGHRERRAEAGLRAREGGAAIPSAGDEVTGYHMTVTLEVVLHDDVAICRSKFLYGTSQGTGGQVHQVGRYHDEVRRTPDGWRLHHRTVFP